MQTSSSPDERPRTHGQWVERVKIIRWQNQMAVAKARFGKPVCPDCYRPHGPGGHGTGFDCKPLRSKK
jgi:hypothetical protein